MAASQHSDLLVVGGGVIGLTVAWRAAQRGLRVRVLEGGASGRATPVAAGMLAPLTESKPTERALLDAGLSAAAGWPAFAAELGSALGQPPAEALGYSTAGTLAVALDADDHVELDRLADLLQRWGLEAERLGRSETRRLEPLLDPGIRSGLLVPGDHAVDPRRLVGALRRVAADSLVAIEDQPALALTDRGARTPSAELTADTVLVAAGCWSAGLLRPLGHAVDVRPVKGQVLRLRARAGIALRRTVRGVVRGAALYLVPRPDGEVVLGATQEELGFDTTVTAGAVADLLRDARALVPAVTELELVEASAGLRPMTPDGLPLVEQLRPGLLLAAGHGRNGVLLAPSTAERVLSLVGCQVSA